MTRTLYDGIAADAVHIPTDAQMVAGYVDGLYAWSAADWARFPNSVKVRIAVFSTTNDGHVLDCEPGNQGNPAQAVDWVLMRRAAGADPTVYCGRNTWWPTIRADFQARGVPEPHYWVADYSTMTVPSGALALQYEDAGPYDLSIAPDYWPGVDPSQGGNSVILGQDDIAAVAGAVKDQVTNIQRGVVASPHTGGGTSTVGSEILALPTRFDALTATLAALTAKVDALSAPVVDPAALAADVKTALQDPDVLRALAHALAVELHNDTPAV